jgi:hypothetical protein
MTPLEYLIVVLFIVSLIVVRFGLPMLVIWLGRFIFGRVLHLNF